MKLSVIIVNYNGGGEIVDAIRSVFATAADMEMQVIVVNNASTDGSMQMISREFGAQVMLVEMGRNAGFAAANNAGLEKASGAYVLFLNPDTVVQDGALQAMVHYMDAHPQTGACGGNLYSRSMQPQFSYWMLLPGWRMEWNGLFSDYFLRRKYHGSHEHNYTGTPMSVAYCMGADLMVRRDVIEQVGKMDEDFFLFYEETELCYRIRKAGYDIVNIPQAKIIHLEGRTIDKMHIRQQQMMRSRDIYLRKCCSPLERMVANVILALSASLRVACFALAANRQKVEYWKYTLQHIYHP